MAKKGSQLSARTATEIQGGEFVILGYAGKSYQMTLDELKKFIGIIEADGGSVDLTQVSTDILPLADASKDIGSLEKRWKKVYSTALTVKAQSVDEEEVNIHDGGIEGKIGQDIQWSIDGSGKANFYELTVNGADVATMQYVNNELSKILGGASGAYDTLKEIEDILKNDTTGLAALLEEIGTKADNSTVVAINGRVTDLEDSDFVDIDTFRDTLDPLVSSLQGSIDSLWSRDSFDELYAGHLMADSVAAERVYADEVDAVEGNFESLSVDGKAVALAPDLDGYISKSAAESTSSEIRPQTFTPPTDRWYKVYYNSAVGKMYVNVPWEDTGATDVYTKGEVDAIKSSLEGSILLMDNRVSAIEVAGYLISSDVYPLLVKDSNDKLLLEYIPTQRQFTLKLQASHVGLGNVENTKLSTWAGSANITTLGTITSGTWNGEKITNAYLDKNSITIAGKTLKLGDEWSYSDFTTATGIADLASRVSQNESNIADHTNKITANTTNLDATIRRVAANEEDIEGLNVHMDEVTRDYVSVGVLDPLLSSLQGGIDSLWSRDSFDELYAGHLMADSVAAERVYADEVDAVEGNFESLSVDGKAVIHTGNITSQSVHRAETAGTAASAGYANSAGQATNDSEGNKIVDTYLKISEYNTDTVNLATKDYVNTQGFLKDGNIRNLVIKNSGGTEIIAYRPTSSGAELILQASHVGLGNVRNVASFSQGEVEDLLKGYVTTLAFQDYAVQIQQNSINITNLNKTVDKIYEEYVSVGVLDPLLTSLQGGIDSLWSRDSFDELYAGHLMADSIAAERMYADEIEASTAIMGNNKTLALFPSRQTSEVIIPIKISKIGSQHTLYCDEAAVYDLGTSTSRFAKVYCTEVQQSSDAGLKDIAGDIPLTVGQIADAPAVSFKWKSGMDEASHVGTIAQYWKDILPEVVSGEEGHMSIEYATLGVVSSIVLARAIERYEKRIAILENKINELKNR